MYLYYARVYKKKDMTMEDDFGPGGDCRRARERTGPTESSHRCAQGARLARQCTEDRSGNGRGSVARHGRRLTAAGRKRLSQLMKKRWAERRRKAKSS